MRRCFIGPAAISMCATPALADSGDAASSILGVFLAIVGVAAYFFPFIIAASRGHRNAAPIFVLNLFGAWTGLLWVAALVWSLSDNARESTVCSVKNCPHCAAIILANAKVCRYCGHDV